MKVTMIAREYPPYVYGGAGVHLRYLSQELAKLMEVEVRCFGNQESREGELKVRGYQPWKRFMEGKHRFTAALSTLSTDLSIVLDEIDSDIVHTHTWYASFAGYLAKMLYQVPLVVTCHSLEPLRPWKEDQLGRGYHLSSWMEQTAIENADRIIAVSNTMKEDILRFFNVPKKRIAVIHNGIDLDKWKYSPLDVSLRKRYGIEDDYILFVGRPTKQKGMEYLVGAADCLAIQVVMAAVGADTKDYEDRMRERVKEKKNIVWIHELLKEEEYIQLYSSAKVFVCPSIYEPFGIINLEAMACRRPVVASAVGGIKEVVIPEETGILVEPANPEQLAAGINRLLRDEKLAKEFGERGRERVEKHFSWAFIAQKTKRLYESLLQ